MIGRCRNKRQREFNSYGARGITVCDRWQGPEGFANFFADMGPRPSEGHSIDRINNDGNYEPGNCRWATRTEQNNNSRHNRRFTIRGETLTLREWSKRNGICEGTISNRLKRGWSPERAVTTPPGPNGRKLC